ncbi:MAG: hypothetical protein WAM97_13065 [Acidimicrobiales bacterium]|jgi:hypothetical protein
MVAGRALSLSSLAVLATLTVAFGSWSQASASNVHLTKLQLAAADVAAASNCEATVEASVLSGMSGLIVETVTGQIPNMFLSQMLALEDASNVTDKGGTYFLSPQDSIRVISAGQLWMPWPGQHANAGTAAVEVRIRDGFILWMHETFRVTLDGSTTKFSEVTKFAEVNDVRLGPLPLPAP